MRVVFSCGFCGGAQDLTLVVSLRCVLYTVIGTASVLREKSTLVEGCSWSSIFSCAHFAVTLTCW